MRSLRRRHGLIAHALIQTALHGAAVVDTACEGLPPAGADSYARQRGMAPPL